MIDLNNLLMDERDEDLVHGLESLIEPQLNDPFVTKAEAILKSVMDEGGMFIKDPKDTIYPGDPRSENRNFWTIAERYEKAMSDLIKERFGLNIRISFTISNLGYYTVLPMEADNVLRTNNEHNFNYYGINFNVVAENLRKKSIIIDKKRAYIIGAEWYSSVVVISLAGIASGNRRGELLDIVAVMLHEIGHNFTFLEYSSKITKHSLVLMESLEYLKSGNSNKSNKILKEAYDVKDFKSRVDFLHSINKKNKELFSINGSFNTTRECERLADEFVNKFGLADRVANFLSKGHGNDFRIISTNMIYSYIVGFLISIMIDLYYAIVRNREFTITLFNISGIFSFVLTFYIMLYFIYTILIQNNIIERIYDTNDNRIVLLKKNYVSMLKNQNLNPNEYKEIISQLEKIDSYNEFLLNELNKHPLSNTIYKFIKGGPVEAFNLNDIDIKLQSMINNNVLTSVRKIETSGLLDKKK